MYAQAAAGNNNNTRVHPPPYLILRGYACYVIIVACLHIRNCIKPCFHAALPSQHFNGLFLYIYFLDLSSSEGSDVCSVPDMCTSTHTLCAPNIHHTFSCNMYLLTIAYTAHIEYTSVEYH